MLGSENRIQLTFEAYNMAKATLDALGKQIKSLGDVSTQAGQQHESAFKRIKENWIAISVVVAEVGLMVREALEYMEEGAKAQQAEESFRSIAKAAGESADEILEAMKRVSNGTIDDSAIMQKAVKGMMQGLSGDQMVKIMEASRVAARVTGTDVQSAYEEITNAIANKMPRSLRQFGLITQDQMKLLEASMAAGITTVDLYKLAMANAEDQAKKLGGAQEDNKEKMQQLKVVFEEVREVIGKKFWEGLDVINGWFKENSTTIREWAAAFVEAFTLIKAEIMRFSMLLDKLGGTMTSAGMLLFGPGAALGNENSKKQFEKMAALNIEFENRYNATDKELQDMAMSLDKRLDDIRKPAATKPATVPANSGKPTTSGPAAKALEDQMKAALASKMREAEIQREIANLDIAEKTRDISHVDAAQKRVDLAEQLLGTQEANLKLIDKDAVGGAQAWSSQQKAIDDTKKKITDFRLALREFNGSFYQGIQEGFARYIDTVRTKFQESVYLAQQTAQGMESAFSDFFFDAMTGKLKSLWDYIKNFLQSVARAIANIMAQQTAQSIIGVFTGSSSPSATGTNVGGTSGQIGIAHTGGLIMHTGGYVPRFHVGGLSSDEVPAILQKGEYVVSRKGVAALDRINQGDIGYRGALPVHVNITNPPGQKADVEKINATFDGEKYIVGVVLKNIESNGALRHTLTNLKQF